MNHDITGKNRRQYLGGFMVKALGSGGGKQRQQGYFIDS